MHVQEYVYVVPPNFPRLSVAPPSDPPPSPVLHIPLTLLQWLTATVIDCCSDWQEHTYMQECSYKYIWPLLISCASLTPPSDTPKSLVLHVHIYVYILKHVQCIFACLFVCMYVYMYQRAITITCVTCTHICLHSWIYSTFICMFVCVCACMYKCTSAAPLSPAFIACVIEYIKPWNLDPGYYS